MTMRRLGIPINVAKSVITGLMDMVCRIRTAHGDSKRSYSAKDLNEFLHGIGQGNGYGPAIWAAISSILFKILQDLGYGTNIIAPITKDLLNLVAISFVDDTDSITLGAPNESWDELIHRAQKGLDMWECLIRTTGGAIEPAKSFWVGINPIVNDKGETVLQSAPNHSLWITGYNGEKEKLTKKNETEANLGLGVWQAPDGQENIQAQKTIKKIQQWNSKVKSFKVDKFEGRSMINMTIGKTIRYPLAATALTNEQCEKITKTLTWAALGKAGVVRTASKLIVNAPTKYGGMGIRTNTQEMQLIDHIKMIMKHGHRQTVTGKLIRATAETLSLKSGVIGDPFQLNKYELDLVSDNTWIKATIRMMLESDIKMKTSIRKLTTWANEDESLMDNIQELPTICGLRFNKVRMYLKVVTLSDVCSADFRFIDKNIFEASRNMSTVTPSYFSYNWPQVNVITETDKMEWQRGLKLIFKTNNTRRLHQTCMRDWDGKYIKSFIWVMHGETTVFQKLNEYEWIQWIRIITTTRYRIRSRQRYVRTENTVRSISERCRPISVIVIDSNTIQIDTVGKVREQYDTNGLYHWTHPVFNTVTMNNDKVIDDLKNGECKIFIGGANDDQTLAKFTIDGSDTVGVVKVPDEPSRYRQALGGILAAVKHIQKIAKSYDISHGTCTIASKCRGALIASFGAKEPSLAWKQIDLLDMIRSQTKQSCVKWKMLYIHGVGSNEEIQENKFRLLEDDTTTPGSTTLHRCTSIVEGERWSINLMYNNIDGLEESIRAHLYESRMKKKWMILF